MTYKSSIVVGERSHVDVELKDDVDVVRGLQHVDVSMVIATATAWDEDDKGLVAQLSFLYADVSVLGPKTGWCSVGRAYPLLPSQSRLELRDRGTAPVVFSLRLAPAEFAAFDEQRDGGDLVLRFQLVSELAVYSRVSELRVPRFLPELKDGPLLQKDVASSKWCRVLVKGGQFRRLLLEVPTVGDCSEFSLKRATACFEAAYSAAAGGRFDESFRRSRDTLQALADHLGDADLIIERGEHGLVHAGRLLQLRRTLASYADARVPGDVPVDQDDAVSLLVMIGGLLRSVLKPLPRANP